MSGDDHNEADETRCWRHYYEHREYVCTCEPPVEGDTGRGDLDARQPPGFILRVPTPEAAGLSGAGSRVEGSDPPRSDSGLRLALPMLGRATMSPRRPNPKPIPYT